MPGVYEQRARAVKVERLAATLVAANIDSELAKEMGSDDWSVAARQAGVNPPSSVTIQSVIDRLVLIESQRRVA